VSEAWAVRELEGHASREVVGFLRELLHDGYVRAVRRILRTSWDFSDGKGRWRYDTR